MYVVVSLEYLEKFILPIDEKSGRYIVYTRENSNVRPNGLPQDQNSYYLFLLNKK
jgi:hypothetical protein